MITHNLSTYLFTHGEWSALTACSPPPADEQRRLAAAQGELGSSEDQEASGTRCGWSRAAGPHGHREDPAQVPQHEEDVLPGEEGVTSAARLQTHLHHHAGQLG